MKKTGICPKCQSEEVYFSAKNLTQHDPRSGVFVASRRFGGSFTARTEIYVCMDCGYIEEYFRAEDLKDEKIREKVKTNWKKVKE